MIRICGDVSITDGFFDVGYGLGSRIKTGFNPISNIHKGEDFWIGNFEGVTSSKSVLTGTSANQFRIDPKDLGESLSLFDIMGVANNHVMQHGVDAYKETCDILENKGIVTFGENIQKTKLFKVGSQKYSITGFSQRIDQFSDKPLYWHNPEYSALKNEIDGLPKDAFKIAYIHWGYEYVNRPSTQQKQFAHLLIDFGYDLIVGMHPHIMQGFELYKNKYIFYSIGNFTFDMPWEPTKYGAIVNVDDNDGNVVISYDYVFIDSNLSTHIIEEDQVPDRYRFSSLNQLIDIEDNGESYFHEVDYYYRKYRKANHMDIFKKIMKHPRSSFYILKDFINRRVLSNNK